ncbi:MAG: outer membrane beta-barrel protein [Hyphomicrobiaceae bacterium]
MKTITLVGLASATLIAALGSVSPVAAADLGSPRGGSIKDGYAPMQYAPSRGSAGPCYIRGDLGYSWAKNPHAAFPVSNDITEVDGTGAVVAQSSTYLGDTVSATSLSNAAFGGVGLGCGSGSRGLRGEVMLNQYGWRNFKGEPLAYSNYTIVTGDPTPAPIEDPMHTRVKSTTLMFNAYYDLGKFGGVTPYVGAGVGVAYNRTGETYFTDNPSLVNRIEGASRLSLAWSVGAGIGWQVSERAVLDVGYRYTDLGKAITGRIDNTGAVNPAAHIDQMGNHEVKVGLRYHLGGGNDCCATQPMK